MFNKSDTFDIVVLDGSQHHHQQHDTCFLLPKAHIDGINLGRILVYNTTMHIDYGNKQQLSPLLNSVDILPARNSRLTKRETNPHLAHCPCLLAWSYHAGRRRSPSKRSHEQIALRAFYFIINLALCCPCTVKNVLYAT